jgi:signal recognition particle subunit SEC65
MRLPRRSRFVALLALALAAPLFADDVHLTNGKVFEGVIADWRGSVLVMRIPGGEMTLARSSVREVVRSQSGYPEFLERERGLRLRADAAAGDWLDLARMALRVELRQSAREAALEAAVRDPRLEGLAPILRSLGYELDERESAWLPREEVMRRRGYLLHEGHWITREEAALLRAEAAEREREREVRERARLERATLQARLAAAENDARHAAAAPAAVQPTVVVIGTPWGWPVLVQPGPPLAPTPPGEAGAQVSGSRRPGATAGSRSELAIDIRVRQPGSLFPARSRSADTEGHP